MDFDVPERTQQKLAELDPRKGLGLRELSIVANRVVVELVHGFGTRAQNDDMQELLVAFRERRAAEWIDA